VNILHKIRNIIRRVIGTDIIIRNTTEILKANLFSSIIKDCEWLQFRSFSYGGMAMDSAALYTLFRILDEIKPQNILEFGLGESSKLIHQFASYTKCDAITIEHDKEWIEFFNRRHAIKMDIKFHELYEVSNNGNESGYKGIEITFGNKKFDFIVVDGPLGTDHYSRSHVLNLIPQHISKTFCIMMDDTHRQGEIETFNKMCEKLRENKIDYYERCYHGGTKSHSIVCSTDLKFLTTMVS
jgi:hypothetical protein